MESSRERFLDAADRAFVDQGYQGATIRAVCAASGASLAILHRNWPSKEALFKEVFRRHFDPIHAAQAARFDQLQTLGASHDVEAILLAFYEPAFVNGIDGRGGSKSVYCRALVDPAREAKRLVAELIKDTRSRLVGLLRVALPDLAEAEFFLVINLVMAAFVFPQAFGHQLAVAMAFDDSRLDRSATARVMARLVATGVERQRPG